VVVLIAAMTEGRPQVSHAEVPGLMARFALPSDGLTIKDLPSYDDLNFHVSTAAGNEYVLKVHNSTLASGTRERLQGQNKLIERLRLNSLPVPEVIRTPDADAVLPMMPKATGAPAPNMRVLTYLRGEIVENDFPKSAEFLRKVGAMVGKIAKALQGFEEPNLHWTWEWDMKKLSDVVTSKLQFISNERQRGLAARLAAEYADFIKTTSDLPHSIIHSDLNDTNLLWSSNEGGEIVGILDFGDAIYNCSAFDPAIAAGYYCLGQPDPLMVLIEVLAGYLQTSAHGFSDDEIVAYFHGARGRVLLSVACSAEKQHLEPDNEYLAHTAKPGWAVLMALDQIGPERALEALRIAARGSGGSGF